jgi:uncharacterized Zn finger protein
MREGASTKALRLLTQGRVAIRHVVGDVVVAAVRGDSAEVYTVEHRQERQWSCTCPARSTCSHVRAVMLCVVVAP